MSTAIISIGTATPEFTINQSAYGDLLNKQIDPNAEYASTVLPLFNNSGITCRNAVMPLAELDKDCQEPKKLFTKNGAYNVPTVFERMAYHEKRDVKLASIAMDDCLKKVNMDVHEITHLITVTTTGVRCPGLDYDLSQHYGLKPSVERFHIHFGGCHAGVQAMRQANYICKADETAVVMIVCVEFSTIYLNEVDSKEQLIVNLLFGDGICATLMVNETKRAALNIPGFIINSAQSVTLPGTTDGVQIRFDVDGLEASVSPNLPEYINTYLPDFVDTNLWMHEFDKQDIDFWAVHTGGKKILNTVSQCLGIDRKQLCYSYDVLSRLGNTQSASIMYVLQQVFNAFTATGKTSANICAIGFGPGVTVELMMMEAVNTVHVSASVDVDAELAQD